MRFPLTVVPELTDRQLGRYHSHIDSNRTGWHRRWTESIWRRHQDPRNARLSGWQSPNDRRRRLIHFYDEYGLEGRAFVLRNAHLWMNVTLPDDEVERYREAILDAIARGGWSRASSTGVESWTRGDLQASLSVVPVHPEDETRGVTYPRHYRNLTVTVRSQANPVPHDLERRPWRWFHDVGMRPMLSAGSPQYIEPEELAEFLPGQLELGCGPSTEAGVPHLSNLHRIYGVSRGDFSFVFTPEDDGLLRVLAEPEEKYAEMTNIYRACMIAEPTPFYHGIRALADRGLIVGPVITNNFDCLCADIGLEETSLRRYDTDPYYPAGTLGSADSIDFDPRARSLIVVGVHADRRLAQLRARERGLTIVYVDPEQYIDPEGRAIAYPVESPQSGDRFVQMRAGDAFPRLLRALAQAPADARASAGAAGSLWSRWASATVGHPQ
jgi:hypothetical protein